MKITNLEQKIIEEIKKEGSIPVDRFMEIALFDEDEGYYKSRQPIGKDGDFTTAPEISQIFGEIIGLFLVSWVLQNLKNSRKINLIELGAGRGVLMSDMLRVLSKFPEIYSKISLHIVDINRELIKAQKQALEKYDIPKFWNSSLDEININEPTLIIANEFFDALPIKQFIFENNNWKERVIKYSDKLYFDSEYTANEFPNPKEGDIKEVSSTTIQFTNQIAQILKAQKGLFITFDYGYFPSLFGDSLQSLYKNKFNPIFENIGHADITAHVDFESIKKTFEDQGITKVQVQTQRRFLLDAGIEKRSEILSRNLSTSKAEEIALSVKRLTDISQMGVLFKCLIAENIQKI